VEHERKLKKCPYLKREIKESRRKYNFNFLNKEKSGNRKKTKQFSLLKKRIKGIQKKILIFSYLFNRQ